MQQHKTVEDYLDNVIPEKISKKIKDEIRAELESHIYDKADFYLNIGYDEEASIKKSIEEMGEAESVKSEFCSLYKDSTIKGLLLFGSICILNLISVSILDLGYWYFVEPSMHHLPNIIELVGFIAIFIFFTVYTIKCYREKLYKQLVALSSAYVLIALASLITSGLFYPIFNAGILVFQYITDGPEPKNDPAVLINIFVLVISATFSLVSLSRKNTFKRKPYKLSLNHITMILLVIGMLFIVIYSFAYAKYEYIYFDKNIYSEEPQQSYLSAITSDQKIIYDSIEGGDDAIKTKETLTESGFIKQNINYEKYISNNYNLPIEIKNYLEQTTFESVIKNNHEIYCFTNSMNDPEEYDDIISCIIVSYDKNNKLIYKMFIPDTNGQTINRSYYNYSHGDETKKWIDKLKKDDDIDSALEYIRKINSYIIEDAKYDGENVQKSYKINMECYYYLDVTFIDFMLGVSPESVDYYFDIEIKSENGTITNLITSN
ncbi:MAG: hypothetical protein IKB88_06970 [Clostridia bacterium]|nr:hypothetical protein [Clostridia bacterium]